MEYRPFFLTLFGLWLAYEAWRARKSGSIMLRWSRLYRSERPRFFLVMLVVNYSLAIVVLALAVGIGVGWIR